MHIDKSITATCLVVCLAGPLLPVEESPFSRLLLRRLLLSRLCPACASSSSVRFARARKLSALPDWSTATSPGCAPSSSPPCPNPTPLVWLGPSCRKSLILEPQRALTLAFACTPPLYTSHSTEMRVRRYCVDMCWHSCSAASNVDVDSFETCRGAECADTPCHEFLIRCAHRTLTKVNAVLTCTSPFPCLCAGSVPRRLMHLSTA